MNKLNENIFHLYNKWKSGYVRKENSLRMRLDKFTNEKDRHDDKYRISEDGKHVDCDESIVITDSDLINGKLPIPFGKVKGDFDCRECKSLISLEGAPKEVDWSFWSYSCPNLTSIVGAPEKVGNDFECSECPIISLEGAPQIVKGDFVCNECSELTFIRRSTKGSW